LFPLHAGVLVPARFRRLWGGRVPLQTLRRPDPVARRRETQGPVDVVYGSYLKPTEQLNFREHLVNFREHLVNFRN
jgi:hypothetical protein